MNDNKKLSPEERQVAEAIVEELASQDKEVRDAAIKKLEKMDSSFLISAGRLISESLLSAAFWGQEFTDDASRTAVRLLVKIGKPAVPSVTEWINEKNHRTTHRAYVVLAKMGDPAYDSKAKATLRSSVEGPDEYKAIDALEAMAEIGDEHAVDFLMKKVLKNHPNYMVRGRAAHALGIIGDKRAIPALTDALNDPDWQNVQTLAKWALEKLSK
ncbi:MAG: HEAT repeat domain-containing protein [Candidatus Aminicenantaceae bacterium]